MSALTNLIYISNAILIKIPANYFVEINKMILKFIRKGNRPIRANTTLKEKNTVGRLQGSTMKLWESRQCGIGEE